MSYLFKSKKFTRTQKAALSTEYGLAVGLIAILVIGSLSLSGQRLQNLFNITGNAVNKVVTNAPLGNIDSPEIGEFQYVVVDLSHSYSTWGAFAELIFKDEAGHALTYSPQESYTPPPRDQKWSYWDHVTIWHKSNMNDGSLDGTGNGSVVYSHAAEWGRFYIDFGSPKTIEEIELSVATTYYKTDAATFYGAASVDYETHLRGRQNTDLTLLGSVTFNYTGNPALVTETVAVP